MTTTNAWDGLSVNRDGGRAFHIGSTMPWAFLRDDIEELRNYIIDNDIVKPSFVKPAVFDVTINNSNFQGSEYTLGNYTAVGGHGDRMANYLGGTYHLNGNTFNGVYLEIPDTYHSFSFDVHSDGSYSYNAAYEAAVADLGPTILSASYTTRSSNPNIAFPNNAGPYKIFSSMSDTKRLESVLVTSAGNFGKENLIFDQGAIEMTYLDDYSSNLLVVTGENSGNSPGIAAITSHTVTLPYTNFGESGTSAATAVMSGIISLLSHASGRTPVEVIAAVKKTAYRPARWITYEPAKNGLGMVDVNAAARALDIPLAAAPRAESIDYNLITVPDDMNGDGLILPNEYTSDFVRSFSLLLQCTSYYKEVANNSDWRARGVNTFQSYADSILHLLFPR